jgi:hypothetical protein
MQENQALSSTYPFFEVLPGELMGHCFPSEVAVAAIENHSLKEADWFEDAVVANVGFQFFEGCSLDRYEQFKREWTKL